MGKQPAFQFYVGDWLKDTRGLSLEAKGAWIDLLNFMWHSEIKGKLSLNWNVYSRHLGADINQTKRVISELIDLNICDCYINSDGKNVTKSEIVTNCNKKITLINRRMYREGKDKLFNAMRVKKHRMKQKSNKDVIPLSSSSSSSSKKYIKNFDCNKCNSGKKLEKNFYKCEHPYIKKTGAEAAKKKLNIIGQEKNREWFDWPLRFNISWLFSCEGFNKDNIDQK